MTRSIVVPLLLLLTVTTLSAGEQELSGFFGIHFSEVLDESDPQPLNSLIGVRWGWSSGSGHGIEVTVERTQTDVEVTFLEPLSGTTFSSFVEADFFRVGLDYRLQGRDGTVRPYATAGLGYAFADLDRLPSSFVLLRPHDDQNGSLTYSAGAGFLIGEGRLRFRYDLRLLVIDRPFDTDVQSNVETSAGFSWIF